MATYSYDQVPYISYPFRQSHPDRLAAVARLFQLETAPIQNCRVLEIGCAGGGNLLPMADQLPESEFIGVDLSQVQIDSAIQLATEAGLTNVDLRSMDLMDVDSSFGEFDYIIAHGVFSWVPYPVQEQILSLCGDLLRPNGVAYVSYNTYPGWHMRRMIREMMGYHTSRFQEPQTRIQQARGLLDFLAENASSETGYGKTLKTEAETLRKQQDWYLFHEHLEDVNEPTYFYSFIERAREYGLEYLGESSISVMYAGHFSQQVAATVEKVATDLIQMEQYLDFVRNRMFRQTLLCHRGRPINRELRPESLQGLYIASPLVPEETPPDIVSTKPLAFRNPTGGLNMKANAPIVKAALVHLAQQWPKTVRFDDLLAEARLRSTAETVCGADEYARDLSHLGKSLLECYVSDLIEVRSTPVPCCVEISERPRASSIARAQVALGNQAVVNRRHESGPLNEFCRQVLALLDGKRDRPALLEKLEDFIRQGRLVVHDSEKRQTLGSAAHAREHLGTALDQALTYLAANALLVHC